MNHQNPHKDAQIAIHWLQTYFKSLRKWIAALDGVCTDKGGKMFETNRASTALGNGYQDNTQWVMNWISRHYYQNGSDRSLLVYLPLASLKCDDEVDVYCYLTDIQHDQVAPDEGIPSYPKDWLAGAAIVNGMRDQSVNQWSPLVEEHVKKAFKGAKAIRVCKVPMTDFGDSVEAVKQKMNSVLNELGNGWRGSEGL